MALFNNVLHGLGDQVNFSCGGTLKIDSMQGVAKFRGAVRPPIVPPVIIRWDNGAHGRKIQFPLNEDTMENLEMLLMECQPATYGFEGQDVLNESYRKAAKLDNNQFSTNFHPHDVGILDAISQIMVSGVARSGLNGDNTASSNWGVVAELYKLNAYSAPSGRFKPHVDTPRGPAHFGSLVVCLPVIHQGGQLRVTHKNQEMLYDFSKTGFSEISWAAFYGDCEHEVLEVASGHRLTLTYNLYISEQMGGVVQKFPSANPTMYSVYEKLKSLLQDPNFLRQGGFLGFYCTHEYAHTKMNFIGRLPYALKGLDAVIFAVLLRGFGFEVFLRPILKTDFDDEYEDGGIIYPPDGDRIATDLHEIKFGQGYEECRTSEIVGELWKHKIWSGVTWLNAPSSQDVAVVHIAYGNQASLEWHYSSLAILAQIPLFSARFPAESASSRRG